MSEQRNSQTVTQGSDIEAAIKAGLNQVQLLEAIPGHRRVAAVPQGVGLTLIPQDKLASPRFLTAAPEINDAAAFFAYVNDFKRTASRIFYDQKAGRFQAVFDYHEQHPTFLDGQCHGDHTATLTLLRSPEWTAWAGSSEKQMGQQSFAEFIEDGARDIIEPSPADMLQVASGLHVTTGGTFRKATNLSNGQVNFQWDEQINGTVSGTVKVLPTEFTIGLRPFMGCDRYRVDCRLRYRIREGALALHYKALHLEQITETALEAIALLIQDKTGIRPAMGRHDAEAFKRGT